MIDRVRILFSFPFSHGNVARFECLLPDRQGGPSVGYLIWRTEVALCGRERYAFEQSSLFLAYFDNDVRDCISRFKPNIFCPTFDSNVFLLNEEEEEVFNAQIICFKLFFKFFEDKQR